MTRDDYWEKRLNPGKANSGNSGHGMLTRIGMGVANAPSAFLNDFVSLGEDVASWLTGTETEWFDVWKPFNDEQIGTAGKVTEELVSFAGGIALAWTGIGALGNAGKFGKISQAASYLQKMNKGRLAQRIAANAIVGAGADFVLGDTEDGNLSNLIQRFPQLQNPVTDYLMHKEDDDKLTKRLKNTLEGIPLGVATDWALDGLGRVLRLKRAKIDDEIAKGATRENLVRQEIGGAIITDKNSLAEDMFKELPVQPKKADIEIAGAPIEKAGAKTGTIELHERYNSGSLDDKKEIVNEILDQFTKNDGKFLANRVNFWTWNFNHNPDEAKEFFNIVSIVAGEREKLANTGVVTFKETAKNAVNNIRAMVKEVTGQEQLAESLIKSARQDTAILAGMNARLTAYRMYLSTATERIDSVVKKFRESSLSEQEMLAFREDVGMAFDLLTEVTNHGTWTSRNLNSRKIIMMDGKAYSPGNLPLNSLSKATKTQKLAELREILEQSGGEKGFADLVKEIEKLPRKNGAIALPGIYKEATKSSGTSTRILQLLREYTATNMLSGLSTQGVNITSTWAHILLRDAFETTIAAGVGLFRRGEDRVMFSELAARSVGAWKQIGTYWKNWGRGMYQQFQEGGIKGATDNFEKVMDGISLAGNDRASFEGIQKFITSEFMGIDKNNIIMKPLAATIDGYGKAARGVSFGTMRVFDDFAKNANYGSELEAALFKAANFMELKGSTRMETIDRLRQWVINYAHSGTVPNISEDGKAWIFRLHQNAKEAALKGTFQNDLDPNSFGGMLNHWLNKQQTSSLVMKTFIVPFFKTPMNLLYAVRDRTPFLYKTSKEARWILQHGTQSQKDRLTAQVISGSMMYFSAASLYFSGVLTGTHNKDERDDLLNAGIPEYSIRIGDSWYSYNRLDPFGYFLGIAADVCSAGVYLNDEDVGALTSSLMMAAANNLINKSYMRSMGETYNAANDPGRYGNSWLKSQVTKFIPLQGTQKTINSVISPEMREVRGLFDAMTNATLGAKGSLPVRLDSLGREVVPTRSPWGIVLGINRVDMQDEASQQIAKYRVYPRDSAGMIKGVKMTDDEHYQMKEVLSKLGVRDRMNDLVQTAAYRGSSDAVKEKILNAYIHKYQSYAREVVLTTNPELRSRILDKRREELKRALLTPGNTGMINGNVSEIRDWARYNK